MPLPEPIWGTTMVRRWDHRRRRRGGGRRREPRRREGALVSGRGAGGRPASACRLSPFLARGSASYESVGCPATSVPPIHQRGRAINQHRFHDATYVETSAMTLDTACLPSPDENLNTTADMTRDVTPDLPERCPTATHRCRSEYPSTAHRTRHRTSHMSWHTTGHLSHHLPCPTSSQLSRHPTCRMLGHMSPQPAEGD